MKGGSEKIVREMKGRSGKGGGGGSARGGRGSVRGDGGSGRGGRGSARGGRGSGRGSARGGRDDDGDGNRMMPQFAQIPTSFDHKLHACLRCRLVKTSVQFRESGCENCPFLEMDKEHDNVANCTTPNFTGIISVTDPSKSWAARWLRIGRFIPGCYTLTVSEELPEEYQTVCADNNVQYVPPKRT